ncbi:hypothetical protein DYB38_011600 [Aphanomyces astaci]|uniref:LamG-like jellyroll fold domain-containing protein n=1 Tax=Aphanomyces astaci TaxID=112090 RepID=A0A397CMX0_APHAT|nr:hypothetical protein DYB38_011600 [Aphanomyces astaci]
MAVLTTHRIVILDPSMVSVAYFTPSNPLAMTPVSMLWIGSAIAFATGGGALYYLPTQKDGATSPTLLCALAKPGLDFSSIQLLACMPDRVVYSVRSVDGVVMVLKSGAADALDVLVHAFRSSNSALVVAALTARVADSPPKSDPFRLLCTEHVPVEARRSRLLPAATSALRDAKLHCNPGPAVECMWKYFTWRRLLPEDASDWIGSPHVHYAAEDFKLPPRCRHVAAGKLSVDTHIDDQVGVAAPSSTASIGPFLDEEDGVVAYWRFEDGANNASVADGVQFVDTSKRENHLTVQHLDLVLSTAPVDRGEEAKLPPEYALRFPSPNTMHGCGTVEVKKGSSSLDIGVAYDEDPYRRCLTVEMWLKSAADWGGCTGTLMRRETPTVVLWEFGLDGGALVFTLLGQTVKSVPFSAEDTWQHVAAVVDITSEVRASVRLAVGGALVMTKEVTITSNTSTGDIMSTVVVGPQLTGMDMTEIRIWATPRSAQQLRDMKDTYLTMAESKKRIKMKIHDRDCQCAKCVGRRQNTPIAKLAMVQPLASLTPTSRDRRQRMKTPKSEETRT